MEAAGSASSSCRPGSAARQFAGPDLVGQVRAAALDREADPVCGVGGGGEHCVVGLSSIQAANGAGCSPERVVDADHRNYQGG